MKRWLLIILMVFLTLFGSCKAPDDSISENNTSSPQEESVTEHDPPADIVSQPQDSKDDEELETDGEDVFPFTEYQYNTPFPSGFFDVDEGFDYENNNFSLKNLSFYLDESDFSQTQYGDISFMEFVPTDEQDIGSCRISFLVEPIEALYYFLYDPDGALVDIETLNGAVRYFIMLNDLELYTLFSNQVHDKYIPGALFSGKYGTGFIFYLIDNDDVYSIAFFSYDGEYAQKHREIISTLLSSLYIS